MRKKIVTGNWKMNKNIQQGKELCNSILNLLEITNKELRDFTYGEQVLDAQG